MSYRLPIINAPDQRGQIHQLSSYLRQLVEQMNYELETARTEESQPAQKAEDFHVLGCYPVGSVYISTADTSPQDLFGGVWEQIRGRFLLAACDEYPAGATGGAAAVTLTEEQIPGHTHTVTYRGASGASGDDVTASRLSATGSSQISTGSTGGGQAHENMPPYISVYVWQRTG